MTRYLDPNTLTKRSLAVMQEEFGSAEQMRLMFHDLDAEALEENVRRLEAMPQVHLAAHNPDTDVKVLDGVTYQVVLVTLRECDAPALVEEMQELFPNCFIDGSAAIQLQVQEAVGAEMPMVMLVAVAVVIGVLLLTSHSWLEPLVILPVLAVSILINMGTNFIFADISFIAFAVSAILQLALSIDYAIMLLHAYNDRRGRGMEPEAAMTDALTESMMPIASSALTTVAGLMSLLFMSFTIGFDIGLVLSKGIVISMLCVFLLMPSVTLLFGKALKSTRHRPIQLGGEHLAGLVYKIRRPLAVLLIAAVVFGFYLQSGNTYLFTDSGHSTQSGESQDVVRVFGESNPMVILVPGGEEDADYDLQRQLADKLAALEIDGVPAIRDISAMVTDGAEALKYYTAQDVAELTGLNALAVGIYFRTQGLGTSVRADRLLEAAGNLLSGNETLTQLRSTLAAAKAAFNGPHYARMLLDLRFSVSSAQTRPTIDAIQAAAREVYGENYYITGVPMSTYDIGNAFEGDLMKVNLITFAAILLIVAVSFRALSLPLLLVFVIEGAIWITMGISRLIHQPIFFMSYLICVSIQMGATIDYGILLSSHYRDKRREGLAVLDALKAALHKALPTVLTSGVILITAGYIIGKLCSVYYISAIGLLLSRGAAVSVMLILTLLPALLAIGDRAVIKKVGSRR
jgi:predicted RND superfamily exporter protein